MLNTEEKHWSGPAHQIALFDHIRLCPWPWEHEGWRPVLRLEPGWAVVSLSVRKRYEHHLNVIVQ